METDSKRGKNPSKKTISILIARAGGRCQFENCNRNIFIDHFTLTPTNNSNVAHIVAASPDGPRGDEARSHQLSDEIENLMLMCMEHHHLIDAEGQEKIYTVERLTEMKRRQEQRVRETLDCLNAEITTMVHLTSPLKGKTKVAISPNETVKAFFPRMKPKSEHPIRFDIPEIYDYKNQASWVEACLRLEHEFRQQVLSYDRTSHFSIFAIAPIPLIMKLGFLFGGAANANVYQKDRTQDSWEWPSEDKTNDFSVEEKNNENGNGVAVVVSVTGEIEQEAIDKVRCFKTVYYLRAKNQGVDSIRSEQDLSEFWHTYQSLLETIKCKRVKKICLFPATPSSVAFEMGRRYMQGVYPKVVVYERDGDYFETITIGEEDDE